jgi:hypothetical protein
VDSPVEKGRTTLRHISRRFIIKMQTAHNHIQWWAFMLNLVVPLPELDGYNQCFLGKRKGVGMVLVLTP